MFVDEPEQLLGVVIEFLLPRRIKAGRSGIVGVHGEAAAGVTVDVHADADLLALRRQLKSGKHVTESRHQLGLNFLLQLFAGGSLQRRYVWIRCTGNEPTLGLRLNAIYALLDETFEFHEEEF